MRKSLGMGKHARIYALVVHILSPIASHVGTYMSRIDPVARNIMLYKLYINVFIARFLISRYK